MKEFNYKDYLKNNPLLGEGHEGGGIPDSDIESDHEHQWEDIGDNEEECKICGLKRSITSEMDPKAWKKQNGMSADWAPRSEDIENSEYSITNDPNVEFDVDRIMGMMATTVRRMMDSSAHIERTLRSHPELEYKMEEIEMDIKALNQRLSVLKEKLEI